jgi:hypothetical protein
MMLMHGGGERNHDAAAHPVSRNALMFPTAHEMCLF